MSPLRPPSPNLPREQKEKLQRLLLLLQLLPENLNDPRQLLLAPLPIENILTTMKTALNSSNQFHLYLDSSDPTSFRYFPENHPADFTTLLPTALFLSPSWKVALKHIHLGTSFNTLFSDSCWFQTVAIPSNFTRESPTPDLTSFSYDVLEHLTIPDRRLPQPHVLVTYLNGLLEASKSDCRVSFQEDRFSIFSFKTTWDNLCLCLSPSLATLLGFTYFVHKPFFIDCNMIPIGASVTAQHPPDLYLLSPRNAFVLCDNVSPVFFGSLKLPILRDFALPTQGSSSALIHSASFTNHEFCDLLHPNITQIRIRLIDCMGHILASHEAVSTSLHLVFKRF